MAMGARDKNTLNTLNTLLNALSLRNTGLAELLVETHPKLIDEVRALVSAATGQEKTQGPTVHVSRAEDGARWLVQIDTAPATGVVTIDLNDSRIFSGDPELFDPAGAAEKALRAYEPDAGDWPAGEMLDVIIEAVRGDSDVLPCLDAGEHTTGRGHRWQECPTYHR